MLKLTDLDATFLSQCGATAKPYTERHVRSEMRALETEIDLKAQTIKAEYFEQACWQARRELEITARRHHSAVAYGTVCTCVLGLTLCAGGLLAALGGLRWQW